MEASWRNVRFPEGHALPKPRRYHSSVLYKGKVYVFGGQQGSQVYLNDLWVLDPEGKTWQELNVPDGPSMRSGHSATLVGSRMFIFGGMTNKITNKELWCLDLESMHWEQILPASSDEPWPSTRHEHTAITHGGAILVYGGSSKKSVYLRDMWLFSLETKTWQQIEYADGPKPAERGGHFIIDTPDPNVFVVFGGFHGDGGFDYHKESWTLTFDASGLAHWATFETPENAPPTGRPLTAQRRGNEIFVFGGYDGHNPNADVRYLTLKDKMWHRAELWMDTSNIGATSLSSSKGLQPLSRYGHTMHLYDVCDDEGDEMVLLIVCGAGSTYLNDVVRISFELPSSA